MIHEAVYSELAEDIKGVIAAMDVQSSKFTPAMKADIQARLMVVNAKALAANDVPVDVFEVLGPEMRVAALQIVIGIIASTIE